MGAGELGRPPVLNSSVGDIGVGDIARGRLGAGMPDVDGRTSLAPPGSRGPGGRAAPECSGGRPLKPDAAGAGGCAESTAMGAGPDGGERRLAAVAGDKGPAGEPVPAAAATVAAGPGGGRKWLAGPRGGGPDTARRQRAAAASPVLGDPASMAGVRAAAGGGSGVGVVIGEAAYGLGDAAPLPRPPLPTPAAPVVDGSTSAALGNVMPLPA